MEFGLTPTNREQLAKDAQRRPFDFIIGSVHFADELDIYLPEYWEGKTPEQAVERFLRETLDCVQVHDGYDVLGHLTYISKSPANPERKLLNYEDHREIFDEILREVARHDKGIEVNTSGVDRCGGPLPTMDLVRRFKELGGKIVTVGSDAHNCERVGQYTHQMVEQVKEIFGYICTFENRQPIFHK
jgi:histidinol-phosphatase (PHP family)